MSLILLQLQAALALIAPFFAVKLFWVLMLLVAIDYATGIIRALWAGEFQKAKLAATPIKAVMYMAYFVAVHATLMQIGALPMMLELTSVLDEVALLLPVTKELVSTLQNIKALALLRDVDVNWLDAIIDFLRLNVYQAVLDRLAQKTAPKEPVSSVEESAPATGLNQ